jgi:hypothetical protein
MNNLNLFTENRLIWKKPPEKRPERSVDSVSNQSLPSSQKDSETTIKKGRDLLKRAERIVKPEEKEGRHKTRTPLSVSEAKKRGHDLSEAKDADEGVNDNELRFTKLKAYLEWSDSVIIGMRHKGVVMKLKLTYKNDSKDTLVLESGGWKTEITRGGINTVQGSMPDLVQKALSIEIKSYSLDSEGKPLRKFRGLAADIKTGTNTAGAQSHWSGNIFTND